MFHRIFSSATVRFSRLFQPRLRRSVLSKVVLLCAGLLCFQGVQAQNINYVHASFSVLYNNHLTQGENRLNIQRNDNKYQIDFVLDHWLLSSSQKAVFEMEQCQVQPISYIGTSKRPFKQETIQTLKFDWEQKKAEYRSEDEQESFDLNGHLYDPISLFFEARCGLMKGQTEFTYPLIRNGSKTTHTYKVVGTEVVETGQGNVEALVVERERRSEKRQTRLYVAPELDYLLVKIEHQESRLAKIVATLKHMDYELSHTE